MIARLWWTPPLCLLMVGCGVSFDFHSPPVVYPSTDPVKRCIQSRVITPAGASARWTTEKSRRSGSYTYVKKTRWKQRGIAFYRRRERLSMEDLLLVLRDPHLARVYMEKVNRHAARGSAKQAAVTALWTIGFGCAAAGLAVGFMGIQNRNDYGSLSDRGKIMTYAGFGSALVCQLALILPGAFVLKSMMREQRLEKIHRTMLTSPGLRKNFQKSVNRHNRRVHAYCTRRYGR